MKLHQTNHPSLMGQNMTFVTNKMWLQLKSIDNEVWIITEENYEIPTTKEEECHSLDKKKENNNSWTMNALYCALNDSEKSQIHCFDTSQNWNFLEVLHEAFFSLKENKLM